jgi:hypothetical protein
MAWLFNHFTLTLFIFIFLGLLGMGLQIVFGQQKPVRFLANYIQARGYQFENAELAQISGMSTIQMWKTINFKAMTRETDGIQNVHLFSNPSPVSLGFFLSFLGKRMTVFRHIYSFSNYSTGAAGTSQSTFIPLMAAKLRYEALPILQVERRSAATMVKTVVDKLLKARGISPTLQTLDFTPSPEFSDLYKVMAENEAQTRTFLEPRRIDALSQTPITGTLATSPDYLVYFEHGKFSDEASYDDFIGRAKSAFGACLR